MALSEKDLKNLYAQTLVNSKMMEAIYTRFIASSSNPDEELRLLIGELRRDLDSNLVWIHDIVSDFSLAMAVREEASNTMRNLLRRLEIKKNALKRTAVSDSSENSKE